MAVEPEETRRTGGLSARRRLIRHTTEGSDRRYSMRRLTSTLPVGAALAAALAGCTPGGDPPTGGDQTAARIGAIFADYASEAGPGCSMGVIQDGRLIHAAGYGTANLDHGIPNGPATIFRTGSVSKQFTAGAIALLAIRGELELDGSRPALHPRVSGLSRRSHGPTSDPPHVRRARLHRAHVPGGQSERGLLHQPGGSRRDQPAARAQFHAGRRVPVQQRRLLPAQRDRGQGLGTEPARVRGERVLRPPGHDPYPLPRRPQRDRAQPRHRLRPHRRRLPHQRDHAGHGGRRRRLHLGGGVGRMGPQPY